MKNKIILLALTISSCLLLYLISVVYRSKDYFKHQRWENVPYKNDRLYGHYPKTNTLAYHSLRLGEKIAVHFDSQAFRIPSSKQNENRDSGKKKILFLGDSFTHGYGVFAERTFSHIVGAKQNFNSYNAGVSGWGYAQILLRARELLPKLKPEIVIIQYSSWLAERSLWYYRQTRWGVSFVPYFSKRNNEIFIAPPLFNQNNLESPIVSKLDQNFLFFLFKHSTPLFLKNDHKLVKTFFMHLLSKEQAKPISSEEEALKYFLNEIIKLSEKYNTKLLFVEIPGGLRDNPKNNLINQDLLVNTKKSLIQSLKESNPHNWSKAYKIWRGNPSQLVDGHPSPRMHMIVAKKIIEKIDDKK